MQINPIKFNNGISNIHCKFAINIKQPILCKLGADEVSFTSHKYRRSEDEYIRVSASDKEDLKRNVPRIIWSNTFEKEEYDALTEREKTYLRKLVNKKYSHIDIYNKGDFDATINKDMLYIKDTAKKMSTKLKTIHPKGHTLIAIGGSPAIFAKFMEYEGEDVKIVPFSKDAENPLTKHGIAWEEYFEELGIDKNFIKEREKSNKRIVIMDYVASGETKEQIMKAFKKAGLYSKRNMYFIDTSYLTETNSHVRTTNFFLASAHISAYCPCPEIKKYIDYKNITDLESGFKWNLTTKLINFAYLDYVNTQKQSS